jgi:hypothetical protein
MSTSTRTVTVVIEHKRTETAEVQWEIDVAEYDEWRGDLPDTPDLVKEFLTASFEIDDDLMRAADKVREWTEEDSELDVRQVKAEVSR